MGKVTIKGQAYSLDDHGFLDPSDQWTEAFAEGMAKRVGITTGLTKRHWQIIRYLRHKLLEEETVPVVVIACSDNGMRLAELRALFPAGYHRGACKVAGINYRFMYETNYWLTYETWAPLKPLYDIDDLGFLADFDAWNEDFVEMVMGQMDPPASPTERHLQVVRYLREYYAVHGLIPPVFEACSANDLTLEELKTLFPAGYRRGACRLAGLPFPG